MSPNLDPRDKYPKPPFPKQREMTQPGETEAMIPRPDHGETTYHGSGRLEGHRALITGGDSGIGRAVAIAFAREGADVAISYLDEEQHDADETKTHIEQAGRRCLQLPGNLRDPQHCAEIVRRTFEEFGGIDVLVLNAAVQHKRAPNADISREEILEVFDTNLIAPILIMRAAAPRLMPGASVIVTASVQSFDPSPDLLDYAMTKSALMGFTRALAEEQSKRGVRVNAVAPGPIWTPLIPATGWDEKERHFGENSPLGRPGQPAELSGAYVYLASEDASYVSGAILAVTGGRHL